MCAPDEVMPDLYAAEIAPHLRAGQTLMFVHGFAYHYGFIKPPADVNVVMVAPKGPGTAMREAFIKGGGLPAIVAVAQDNGGAEALAYSYGAAIGCGRAGMIASTFKIETEGDLYGEQVVLCRRPHASHPHRLGSAGRSRHAAGARLLRLPARSETALRSHPRTRHRRHAPRHLQHRRVRRIRHRPPHHRRPRQRRHARRDGRRAVRQVRAATGWPNTAPARRTWRRMREAAAAHPIEAAGRTVRALLGK